MPGPESATLMRVAVCMPVYGKAGLTNQVIEQLALEAKYTDIFVCDNLGDYEHTNPAVQVVRPGTNLGWLRGTNYVWKLAAATTDYDAYVLLNNDVVLCERFIARLCIAVTESDAAVVVPLYDRGFPEQIAYTGPAREFVPSQRYDPAHWMDGTCMLVTRDACDQIGFLDDEHFGRYGWGASLDYGIRARRSGYETVVSHQAFLNHLEAATANAIIDDYDAKADAEREEGMRLKYGKAWRTQLTSSWIKILMYRLLQFDLVRSLARSVARLPIGRRFARRAR